MFTVTIKCADAAELSRLAEALGDFCAVQAGQVAEQAQDAHVAETAAKTAGRKKRKSAAAVAAVAAETTPLTDTEKGEPVAEVTDEQLIEAVRTAMRGEGGVAAVRRSLDGLGLKTAMDAKTPEQRAKLLAALIVLAPKAVNV